MYSCIHNYIAQKKTKDLTRRLQQAEDTMKLAAGAMGKDRRKYLEMSKPNYKVATAYYIIC